MIPDGWCNARLGDLVEGSIRNGYSPNSADRKTGYWVLSLGSLTDAGINSKEIKPVEPEQKVLQSLLYEGDFLISRSNTPDKVGRSIRFTGEIQNCSYPDLMMRFRANEKVVSPRYLEAVLKSFHIRTFFKRSAAGSSRSMVKITKTTVEKTPILLPPIPEQKKIAQILSTWDKAIETVEKLIENSQQKKKALMQQLLIGKKRFPGFDVAWKEVRLGNIVEITTGSSKTKYIDEKGERFILDMGSVSRDGKLIPSKRTSYADNHLFKGQLVMPKDDIGGGNIIGRVGYVDQDDKYILGDHVYALSVNTVDPLFLSYLINGFTVNKSLRRKANGTAQLGLGRKDVEKQVIVIPPSVKEQQQITSVLSSADQETETWQKELAHLKQEKKALMQQLLTGKRRVKVNP